MPKPLIQLEQVQIARDLLPLTRPIQLDLLPGHIYYLKGVNGAGKTTLLYSLLGLVPLYAGQVKVSEGTSILFIGHKPGLNAHLTVYENIEFLVRLNGYTTSPLHISDALKTVGLDAYEHTPVHQLSSGQQRRVQLARLWLPLPYTVWILDEPFTAIDTQTQLLLEQRLQQFAQAGGSVLFTSHQPVRLPYCEIDLNVHALPTSEWGEAEYEGED